MYRKSKWNESRVYSMTRQVGQEPMTLFTTIVLAWELRERVMYIKDILLV